MGTIWQENQIASLGFSRARRERTGRRRNRGVLREQRPYLRLNRFQGVRSLSRKENSAPGSVRRIRVRLRYRAKRPRRDVYLPVQVREY